MTSSSLFGTSSNKRRRISTVIRGLLLIFYVVTIVDGFVVIPSVATTFLSQSLSSSPSSCFPSLSTSLNSNNNDSDDDRNVDRGLNLLGVASKVVPQGNIVKTVKFFWKFIWLRFMTELAPQDKTTGDYKRPTYGFDNFISKGSSEFPIESDRYHLYVGNPCPWCHRVRLIVNILKLQSTLDGVTILIDNPEKASRGGWIFNNDATSSSQLQQQKFQDLRELYDHLSPGYTGRCTAPLLVDWKTNRIVSNESKDIVRMLPLLLQTKDKSSLSLSLSLSSSSTIALDPTLISTELQSMIDERYEWIYELVNNGVYRCGFATTQYAYDVASKDVLTGLKRIEDILSNQNYLCSNTQFTESDLMLLPTMLRYDGVYGPLFNAGGTHIRIECDYPYIFQWLKRCWNDIPGVKDSIDITDACESYYRQLFPLNPGGIVPSPSITSTLLHLD